jgi:hypothetical protein
LLVRVSRCVGDEGQTSATIAVAVGSTADELWAYVFGLTLTAVSGGRVSTPAD